MHSILVQEKFFENAPQARPMLFLHRKDTKCAARRSKFHSNSSQEHNVKHLYHSERVNTVDLTAAVEVARPQRTCCNCLFAHHARGAPDCPVRPVIAAGNWATLRSGVALPQFALLLSHQCGAHDTQAVIHNIGARMANLCCVSESLRDCNSKTVLNLAMENNDSHAVCVSGQNRIDVVGLL